jgi:predicted aspartyl protease
MDKEGHLSIEKWPKVVWNQSASNAAVNSRQRALREAKEKREHPPRTTDQPNGRFFRVGTVQCIVTQSPLTKEELYNAPIIPTRRLVGRTSPLRPGDKFTDGGQGYAVLSVVETTVHGSERKQLLCFREDDDKNEFSERTPPQSPLMYARYAYEKPTTSYDLRGADTKAVPGRIQTRARCADAFPEPTINGRLQGVDVSAFPDTGAAANYISLPYAQRHGLVIKGNVRQSVKVGEGSIIRVVGTTTLPFSFAEETKQHDLTFHVIRKSVHDVILGSAFLRTSETFTRFAHRVGRKIRETISHGIHRLCFLGSQQYVNGLANDVEVDAVPDTGADVSVMSTRFADDNGFEVNDDEQHQILFGFADGSTARAYGVVRDVAWRFGSDEQTYTTDV